MQCLKLCVLVVLLFQFRLSSPMQDRCSLQGDIRIEGSNNRVEVCHRGRWGSVCGDSGWDSNAAKVVCRQLGQPFTGAEARSINKRGSPRVELRIVTCNGNEESLLRCTFRLRFGRSNVCSVNNVATVACRDLPPTTELTTNFLPTTQQTTDLPSTTQQTTNSRPTTQQTTTRPPTTQQRTDLPSTTQQTTNSPLTTQQTTTNPPTTQQTTTSPPTTQQTTNSPPTTQQTTTSPPTTQQTTTRPLTTQQTTINPPTTQQTTNSPPTTQQTTNSPPTTQQTTNIPPTIQQEATDGLLTSGSRLEIDTSPEFIQTTSTVTVTIKWRDTTPRSTPRVYEVQCTSVARRGEQQDTHTRIVRRRNQAQIQGLRPNTSYSCCVSVESETSSQDVSNCTQLTTPMAQQGSADSFIILVILLTIVGLILVAMVIGWVVTCVVLRRRYGKQNIESRSHGVLPSHRQDLNFDNPAYQRNRSHPSQPDVPIHDCGSLQQLGNHSSVEPTYERLHLKEGAGPTYDVITQSQPGHNERVRVQNGKKIGHHHTFEEPQGGLVQGGEYNTLSSAGEDDHLYHVLEVRNEWEERNEPKSDDHVAEKTNKNKDDEDHDYYILEDNTENQSGEKSTAVTRTNDVPTTTRGDLNNRGSLEGDPQDYEMPIPTQKTRGEGQDDELKH